MKIRIYNVRILTMEPGREIFCGELHTEDQMIRYVGPERKESCMEEEAFDREIDGGGNLLLPGFKNAHAHSPMTFLRSYADDLPLKPWLNDVVFPAEARLTTEDTYWTSLLAVMEYLTSGITSVFDMYFIRDGLARAAQDCGFRVVFCGALNDFCESAARMEQDYSRYNLKGSSEKNREDNRGLLSFRLGFHAEYTTGGERLRQMAALAEIYQAPVYTHLSETKEEVESCIRRNGMSPVAYLDSLGIFRYGGAGFHMVHLEEGDYEIIRKRKLTCVTNPASNMKLASGIAPVGRLLREGIPVAIGTDGAASNNCLDMFREMFLVTGLQKLKEQDAAAVPAMEVLKMATVNGAWTMGLWDCDMLREGKKADLILIDLDQPNMRPVFEQSIAENLVYSGSKQNVKLTMVDGKVLYEDGRFFLGIPKEEIYEQVRCVQEKIALCRTDTSIEK